jgi:hypothetical protein
MFTPAIGSYASNPPESLFGDLAQVGATLLVAYAVEVSWILKISIRRGRNEAHWVGITTGLGVCGVIGVAFALVLSAHGVAALSFAEELIFGWTAASLGMLGFLVALLPFSVYEWSHAARTEYPDE